MDDEEKTLQHWQLVSQNKLMRLSLASFSAKHDICQ
jgi:hypothetical protein